MLEKSLQKWKTGKLLNFPESGEILYIGIEFVKKWQIELIQTEIFECLIYMTRDEFSSEIQGSLVQRVAWGFSIELRFEPRAGLFVRVHVSSVQDVRLSGSWCATLSFLIGLGGLDESWVVPRKPFSPNLLPRG